MSNRKRKFTIFIDKTVGAFFFTILGLFHKKKNINLSDINVKKILIIRPGGIGDYLLSIPTFKKIKEIFPDSKIDIAVFKRTKKCLDLYDSFNHKILIDNPKEFLKFVFKKKDYDLTIDFDQHRKIPSMITLLSKAKVKVGFDNNGKGKAYNYPIEYPAEKYEALNFLDLLSPFKKIENFNEEDLLLIKKSIKTSKKIDNIGIYAAAMKEENRLSAQKWVEIIQSYGKDKTYSFLGSANDLERGNSIAKSLGGYRIMRQEGKLQLKESIDEISKMDLLLSEDGGVYHMGVCAGVPTISYWLHGEQNMQKWKAPFQKHMGVLLDGAS